MSEKTVTMNELRQLVRDEKIMPSQIYDAFELINDPIFKVELEKSVDYELKKKKKDEEPGNADHIPDSDIEPGGGDGDSDDGGPASHIPD